LLFSLRSAALVFGVQESNGDTKCLVQLTPDVRKTINNGLTEVFFPGKNDA
jgi:hypothetical protein